MVAPCVPSTPQRQSSKIRLTVKNEQQLTRRFLGSLVLVLEDPELSPMILKPRAGDLHGVAPNRSQDRDVSESH